MALAPYSPTGTVYQHGAIKTYEHIATAPTTDTIASCNACGRANYERTEAGDVTPNGLQLIDVAVNPNGVQRSITKLCPECIKDLRAKLFPHSA